ncbi:hypothetical protein C2857_005005 [Epichloe festucae Fl1]|uniref:Uncharacterized protein n=1 Tax=Epichloe festucae (strain Fl1) TaxID=877507 RepID=A0A7S9KSJ6_EPIFF|nr:hypothetical protein C2857_005005 [Epichloe festucae Fl1]
MRLIALVGLALTCSLCLASPLVNRDENNVSAAEVKADVEEAIRKAINGEFPANLFRTEEEQDC